MDSLAAYTTYRKAGRELIHKVMQASLRRDALERSGKMLGISRGGLLVFDSEEEMAMLFDFALNDHRVHDKNAIELYSETVGPANEVERDLLTAWTSAYTSLFKVVSVSEGDSTLLLRDLLNKRDDIKLTDVNLSSSATPDLLLFIRLVPLGEFNTTSGFTFAFPEHLEKRLLRGYERAAGTAEPHIEAQRRFIFFFKAHRAHGFEVRFE